MINIDMWYGDDHKETEKYRKENCIMNKTIKMIGTIATITIMLVCAYLLGATQAKTVTEIQTVTEIKEVVLDGYIDMESDEFKENYVDMRKVTYYEAIDGLQLYFEDGTGYYWE